MARNLWSPSWLAAILAFGCTGPAINLDYMRDLERCAGSHPGTFTGDLTGTVQGELRLDGRMSILLSLPGGDLRASSYVDAEGTVTGSHETLEIEGTYQFEGCEGSGSWHSPLLEREGEWTLIHSGEPPQTPP